MSIGIKSATELAAMRRAGKTLAGILEVVRAAVRPGITTAELDRLARAEMARRGVKPSFLGYQGFPATICVSVNEQIVHGIPGERVLAEGDIVSLDIGDIQDGFQADMAITIPVGQASPEALRLIAATEGALVAGIEQARPGKRLGDLSSAIQQYGESRGYSVVREYTGHGIGREMHEEPQVPNFGFTGTGPEFKAGMTIAIEPMLCVGDWHTRVGANCWTVSTADGKLSAHFEHTVAITEGEPEVLTAL